VKLLYDDASGNDAVLTKSCFW